MSFFQADSTINGLVHVGPDSLKKPHHITIPYDLARLKTIVLFFLVVDKCESNFFFWIHTLLYLEFH